MKMKNSNYWINRSNQRMHEYLQDSEKVSAEIGKAYRQSERYIKSETDKIFQNFIQHTGISETEARLLLKTSIGQTAVDKLKSALSSVSDENIRKQMLAQINAPVYQARIKRLEELNKNIVNECNKLYGTELKLSTELYTDIADKAYSRTIYDIQKGTGIGYSFSQLPKSRIDEILRNNWSGKHYSQRIWGNTQKLAVNLREDLLSGILSGKSGRKIAEDISKRYGVSIKNAERLVRTETNYIANQAEIESYKESGTTKYRFVATLDSRTSEICQSLDGQEFSVSDAQSGVNLPPMHAHCRSTTISVISEKCIENLERRAKNPDGTTSKVSADMSYRDWKKSQKNSLTSGSSGGKLRDIVSDIEINSKYYKGKVTLFDVTEERINKTPNINIDSLSDEMNEKLYNAQKELLKDVAKEELGIEYAYTFNMNMKKINLAKGTSNKHSVNIQREIEDCIIIHNHPDNLPFSPKDFETFAFNSEIRILGAVGHNGNVYYLEKTDKFDNSQFDFDYYNLQKKYGQFDEEGNYHFNSNDDVFKFIDEIFAGGENSGFRAYIATN